MIGVVFPLMMLVRSFSRCRFLLVQKAALPFSVSLRRKDVCKERSVKTR